MDYGWVSFIIVAKPALLFDTPLEPIFWEWDVTCKIYRNETYGSLKPCQLRLLTHYMQVIFSADIDPGSECGRNSP